MMKDDSISLIDQFHFLSESLICTVSYVAVNIQKNHRMIFTTKIETLINLIIVQYYSITIQVGRGTGRVSHLNCKPHRNQIKNRTGKKKLPACNFAASF